MGLIISEFIFWILKKFRLIEITIIIIIPSVRLDIQLLFEITNNMPADVIEILFVISDEELVNIEDNDVESSMEVRSGQN